MDDNSKLLSEASAIETQEWIQSLDEVLDRAGPERMRELFRELSGFAQLKGVRLPFTANTPYINTIPATEQPAYPGDLELEYRIGSIIRWNAMAMVVKANRSEEGIGGHIASYASSATLYEVGFNHFFRGNGPDHKGDLIYFQGMSLLVSTRVPLSRGGCPSCRSTTSAMNCMPMGRGFPPTRIPG